MRRLLALGGVIVSAAALLAQPPIPDSYQLPGVPPVHGQPAAPAPEPTRDVLRTAPPAVEPAANQPDEGLEAEAARDAEEIARRRTHIAELLAKLEAKRAQAGAGAAVASTQPLVPPPPAHPVAPAAPAEPPAAMLKRGEEQFRNGQYEVALATLRAIDVALLSPAERSLVHYLRGGCLRQMNKFGEASASYREVVAANGDAALVEGAGWHLEAIATTQAMTNNLNELRRKRAGQ